MRILLFLFLFSYSMLVSMEHQSRRPTRSLPAKPADADEKSARDLLDKYKKDFIASVNEVGVFVMKFGEDPHDTRYRTK